MNDRIELLTRNLERLRIVGELLESIRTCNENPATECDVCVGMRFSINIINRRMEK